MATSAFWYGKGLKHIGSDINWLTDTIKFLVCTSSYTPSQDTHEFVSDITNEVTASGYARQTITSPTVTFTSPNVIYGCASPISIASVTMTGRYAVFFKSTGTDSTSPLIGYQNAGIDISSTSPGNWLFTEDASGLFTITRS